MGRCHDKKNFLAQYTHTHVQVSFFFGYAYQYVGKMEFFNLFSFHTITTSTASTTTVQQERWEVKSAMKMSTNKLLLLQLLDGKKYCQVV